jgi:formate dehydrogenase major subunit
MARRWRSVFQTLGGGFRIPRPGGPQPDFPASGKQVAVIGAGVAGLTAARELALSGHGATVFEKHRTPGGMLNQGIPAFRLPREIIDREIHQIAATGVTIRCGVDVGTDVTLTQLAEDFDAVVLAAGTLRPNVLGLPGKDLTGIEHGLGFLLQVNQFGRRDIGRRVVVIGGGYTAIDCAGPRCGSARKSASSIAGRETWWCCRENSRSYRRKAGTWKRITLRRLSRRPGQGNRHALCAYPARNPAATAGVRRSRSRSRLRDRRRHRDPRDRAVSASGMDRCGTCAEAGGARRLAGERHGPQTAQRNIFVAGDFALGATTLIQAIGHAKECARKVDEWLTGAPRTKRVARISTAFRSKLPGGRTTGRTAEMNVIPIHPMPTLAVASRGLEAEVETGFAEPVASEEASRCYLCHYKFEIVDRDCVLCDECLKVKPVEGCIVEIASLLRDDEGRVLGYTKVEKGGTDSLYYNRLWIDQSQCIRCGRCEAVCPVNAITIQKVSLGKA